MSDKITIIQVRNPFNRSDREIRPVDFIERQTLAQYVQAALAEHDPGTALDVSVNGQLVPEEDLESRILQPGDCVAIVPHVAGEGGGGKNWGRILAGLALMFITMGVGSFVAGGLAWTGFIAPSAWGFWAWAAALAVNYYGGQLIANMFPPPQQEQRKPSWSAIGPLMGEGTMVGETYGTVRTGGVVLAQHITTDGEKQYYNYLACGGAGEIDSVSGILIGDNPLENYQDVLVDIRLGENDQTVIPAFADTYEDLALTYELQEGAAWDAAPTHQTAGAGGSGLEITIECPMGLHRREDDGDLKNATVQMEAQYRLVGAPDWIDWNGLREHQLSASYYASTVFRLPGYYTAGDIFTPGLVVQLLYGSLSKTATVISSDGNRVTVNTTVPTNIYAVRYSAIDPLTITAATNNPVRRTYRKDGLPMGRYEVRVRCILKSGTGDKYATDVFWTCLSDIIYDDFTRPGKVLIGLRALATDQLQGSLPPVTWLQTRANVWVWDPDANGGAGGYVQKPANNPAWACYDMIHKCRRIKNIHNGQYEYVVKGKAAARLDYTAFTAWAQFCTDRDLRFNYHFRDEQSLESALKIPETIGRGKVIMRGTRFSCIWDGPGVPVQLFTVGNITEGSFSEEFTSTAGRANAVEVTFLDEADNYKSRTILVPAPGWDESTSVATPTRIDLPGCTRLAQAWKHAKYLLRLNTLVRAISWGADVDAIACQIGDVVNLQHDVPQWGFGGRLGGATTDTLTLDREVEMEPGKSYRTTVRRQDDAMVERDVTNQAGTGARPSVAYDRLTGAQVASDVLRYEPDGVLLEEGTTVQPANPFFVSGVADWLLYVNSGAGAVASKAGANGGNFGGKIAQVTVTNPGAAVGDVAFYKFIGAVTNGQKIALQVRVKASNAFSASLSCLEHVSPYAWFGGSTISITTAWQTFTHVATANKDTTARIVLDCGLAPAGTVVDVDFLLAEPGKAYSTSPHDSTRAADSLTLPAAGWAKGNLQVDMDFTPTSITVLAGSYANLWRMQIDASNAYYIAVTPDGKIYAQAKSGDTYYSAVALSVAAIDTKYHITAKWDGTNVALFINGTLQRSSAYTEPVGTLPATASLGSSAQANGLYKDLRVGACLSDAEIAAEWAQYGAAGQPYPINPGTVAAWRLSDNTNATTKLLRVATPYDPVPAQYDPYTFGEVQKQYKPVRLLRVQRSGDLRVKLSGLEYVESVYTEDDTAPVINPSALVPSISNLRVTERYEPTGRIWLTATWTPPRYSYFGARILVDGIQIGKVGVDSTAYTFLTETREQISITVVAVDSNGYDLASVMVLHTPAADLAPPPPVTTLADYYEGNTLMLGWNPVDTSRQVWYEVRKDGADWDSATVLGRVQATAFPAQGPGLYRVASCSIYGAYSTPDTLTIDGNTTIKNYIATYDEAPAWSGAKDAGIVVVGSELWLAGSGLLDAAADFDAVASVDALGGIPSPAYYTIPADHLIDIAKAARCGVTASATLASGAGTTVTVQYRTAGNDDVFGAWTDYTAGEFVGKKFEFRLKLTSNGSTICKVSAFTFSVDVPDLFDSGKNVTVPEGGAVVSFNQVFHVAPSVLITILDAEPNDDAVVTAVSATQFTVTIWNSGLTVERSINWHAQGY